MLLVSSSRGFVITIFSRFGEGIGLLDRIDKSEGFHFLNIC